MSTANLANLSRQGPGRSNPQLKPSTGTSTGSLKQLTQIHQQAHARPSRSPTRQVAPSSPLQESIQRQPPSPQRPQLRLSNSSPQLSLSSPTERSSRSPSSTNSSSRNSPQAVSMAWLTVPEPVSPQTGGGLSPRSGDRFGIRRCNAPLAANLFGLNQWGTGPSDGNGLNLTNGEGELSFSTRSLNASGSMRVEINEGLSYRTDLDMAMQLRTVARQRRDAKKERIEAERTAAELLHRDERTHKAVVRRLLVEAATYQYRNRSSALNEHIRKVSNVGPGKDSFKVPPETLRILFEDMDIIHRRHGPNGVLQSVAKLPLWQL